MKIGDFDRKAFISGFWRGLAAPVEAFTVYDAPSVKVKKFTVRSSFKTKASPQKSLLDDWTKVGESLDASATKYKKLSYK